VLERLDEGIFFAFSHFFFFKTTFLNLLSSQYKATKGTITVNGKETKPRRPFPKQAYVEQEDYLYTNFTTRELLEFNANLSLGKVSKKEKEEKVTQIIKALRLTRCEHTRVGDAAAGKGLSGGEKKRLSAGLLLLKDPEILYLDGNPPITSSPFLIYFV